MSAPMSQKRMAEIRQHAEKIREWMYSPDGAPTTLVFAGIEIMELLAEVERQRQCIKDLEETLRQDNERDRNEQPSW